jgi:hypothetical protein
MSKRMTVIALLLVAMAVPLAPIAKAHGGDDADVMRCLSFRRNLTSPGAQSGAAAGPAGHVGILRVF